MSLTLSPQSGAQSENKCLGSVPVRRLFLCQGQMGSCDCLFPRFAERFLNVAHVLSECRWLIRLCAETPGLCSSSKGVSL